uniref:Uncharacterized protein n=1 Tax=Oryza meridionalis TaxID=40149 RepID=A0A0E0F3K5_9ORYZ
MVDDLEHPMDLVSQPGEVNAAMWAKAAPPLPVAEKADAAADEEENVESSDGPAILGARRRPRSESDGDVAHDSTTVYQKKGGLMARDRQPLGDSEAPQRGKAELPEGEGGEQAEAGALAADGE